MNDTTFIEGLIPLKMCSAMASVDRHHPGWNIDVVDDGAAEEPAARGFEHYVEFASPFSSIPAVHAGIAGFDIDNADTGRLSLKIEELSCAGFRVSLNT